MLKVIKITTTEKDLVRLTVSSKDDSVSSLPVGSSGGSIFIVISSFAL